MGGGNQNSGGVAVRANPIEDALKWMLAPQVTPEQTDAWFNPPQPSALPEPPPEQFPVGPGMHNFRPSLMASEIGGEIKDMLNAPVELTKRAMDPQLSVPSRLAAAAGAIGAAAQLDPLLPRGGKTGVKPTGAGAVDPFHLAKLSEESMPPLHVSDTRRDVASHMAGVFDPAAERIEQRFTDPARAAEAAKESQPQRDLLRQAYGDTITIHRAAAPATEGRSGRTIFSWTLDPKIAKLHLGEPGSKVVTKKVPVDDVLWFGNPNEAELLLRDSGVEPPPPGAGY